MTKEVVRLPIAASAFLANPAKLNSLNSRWIPTCLIRDQRRPGCEILNIVTGTVVYTLNTPQDDVSTLTLKDNPALQIKDEIVTLPAKKWQRKKNSNCFKKRNHAGVAATWAPDRVQARTCDLTALKDHIGIRQNIAAWTENLNWIWPDGSRAQWNKKYWDRGTPKPGFSLHQALNDMFMNQSKYSIGCYTATKLVTIQGVLDYYRRIKKDPVQLKLLEDRLVADKEPLVDIEPGKCGILKKISTRRS